MRSGKSAEIKAEWLIVGDGRIMENANIGVRDGWIVEVSTGAEG